MTGPTDKTLHSHQDNFEDGKTKCEKKIHKGSLCHLHSTQLHVQTLHRNAIRNTATLSWKGLPFMNNIKLLWGLQFIETTYRRNENKYL